MNEFWMNLTVCGGVSCFMSFFSFWAGMFIGRFRGGDEGVALTEYMGTLMIEVENLRAVTPFCRACGSKKDEIGTNEDDGIMA